MSQRAKNKAHRQLVAVCNGLYQVPPTYACDRFNVGTSDEALYIEGMHSTMVELDGDADNIIAVALDAYELRDVPFLTAVPVGRDILSYRFE